MIYYFVIIYVNEQNEQRTEPLSYLILLIS